MLQAAELRERLTASLDCARREAQVRTRRPPVHIGVPTAHRLPRVAPPRRPPKSRTGQRRLGSIRSSTAAGRQQLPEGRAARRTRLRRSKCYLCRGVSRVAVL